MRLRWSKSLSTPFGRFSVSSGGGRRRNAAGGGCLALLLLFALCCGGPLALVSPPSDSPSPATTATSTTIPPPVAPPEADDAPELTVSSDPPQSDPVEPATEFPVPRLTTEKRDPPAPVEPATTSPAERTWTDASGRFQVAASFVGFRNGSVSLRKPSGEIVAVPLDRLSAPDQLHVQEITELVKIIDGRVVGITDGDTITVLDGSKTQHKVRLEGIDTPENGQDFGTQARRALGDKVYQQTVRVEWLETDRYGRTLGHVFVGPRWINRELVAEGWAWHYKEYSSDVELAQAEVAARSQRLGLWRGDNPIPPWDYRHRSRVAVKPQPPPTVAPDHG
ncbi:MAG: thermonuclease family protein [Planctomycetes bacterium]|nr:thermonuclease family protein [Planctomycetota bacterium]